MTVLEFNARKFRQVIYSRKHAILSEGERHVVWDFLKSADGQGLLTKPSHHRYTWTKCSGAFNTMLTNPGYYRRLLEKKIYYPNQLFH